MCKLIVFTFLVKYPSSDSFYLTSKAFFFTRTEDLSRQVEDYKKLIEVDNFTILNMNALIIEEKDIKTAFSLERIIK